MKLMSWRTWVAPVLVAAAILPAAPTGAQPDAQPAAQAACGFVLGFATLRNLITAREGRDVVGACLENERFNPANGNAEQRTAGGLLVWRKADNWTAFTDGFRTWLNGPSGLQQRLNSQRFPWEADAGAPGTTTLGPAGSPDPNLDIHVLPPDTQFIMALEDVRIRSGPGTAFSTIGGLAAGQTARVTGLSLDRQWRRVVCPNGTIGDCWMSADPQLTQPVALYDGAPWRTYANVTYGFQLEIPAWGRLSDPNGRPAQGPCGLAVREGLQPGTGMTGALVDNLVFVEAVTWQGSIREYLDKTEPNAAQIDRLYVLRPLVSNADEAVLVERRPGVEPAAFPVPLGFTLAVHKKGTRLLVVRPLQNPGTPIGCVAESPQQLQRIAGSLLFVETGR
jgi:hypothetical protein